MFKQVANFTYDIGGKMFHFFCDSDSPMESLKQVVFMFTKDIGQIEEQIKAFQASQAKNPPPAPPVEPVVPVEPPITQPEVTNDQSTF